MKKTNPTNNPLQALNSDDGDDSTHSLESLRSTFSIATKDTDMNGENRPNPLYYSAIFIIVTEFCERVAYYGFAGSLVLFFQTQFGYNNEEADVQFSVWAGMAYCTPLIGGFVADKYLGRYNTILVFSTIYLIGLCMVVGGADPNNMDETLFFFGMYVIALGTGGIKPNVSTLGADQFDDRYPVERKGKESFFNYFYWSINLGACLSYTFVAYICQEGAPGLGGKKFAFVAGFSIPTILMFFAIIIFVLGTPRYKHKGKPEHGSRLEQTFYILYEALWTRRQATIPMANAMDDSGSTNSSNGSQQDSLSGKKMTDGHKLDRACKKNGGSFEDNDVECVKLLVRITPFLGALVLFWGIYSQMSTAFQNQACQMDPQLGDINVPVSFMQLFDTIAIIILVPCFDMWIYPALHRSGFKVGLLTRMGWGFLFAAAAMAVAGFVETSRLHLARDPGDYYDTSARDNISPCFSLTDYNPYKYQDWYDGSSGAPDDAPANCHTTCDTLDAGRLSLLCISCDDIPQTSRLSIMAQVPQFLLIGVAEILASISSLEFFYGQSPASMRSVSQAVNLFTTALGSWMTIPLLYIVNSGSSPWVPANLDDGHLNAYFFLLSGLMGLNILLLYYIAHGYVYVTPERLAEVEGIIIKPNPTLSEDGTDGISDAGDSTTLLNTSGNRKI